MAIQMCEIYPTLSFCRAEDCTQKVFTERLPHTVERYARRTLRLSKTIRKITIALGGEGGSRLASQLGINASGDTFYVNFAVKV